MSKTTDNWRFYKKSDKKKRGMPRVFNSREDFWDAFLEYEEHCKNNPLTKNESIKSGPRAGQTFPVEMPQVMTIRGFAIYLGITRMTLHDYGHKEKHGHLHEVYQQITDAIADHKYKHGMVGNYDAKIVMSDLKMRERMEMEQQVTLNFGKDEEDV